MPAMQPPNASSLRFVDLPLELRQKIYTHLFKIERQSQTCNVTCYADCRNHRKASDAILYTSRQIHAEAWPCYTECHKFIFREPFQLANEFLSFLPKQRLACIKHLALEAGDWSDRVIKIFELMWWHYLDVFSRLDTFILQDLSGYKRYGLYRLLPVMIGLLEQGAKKRPLWVSRKYYVVIPKPPQDLPCSYDWVLQCASLCIQDRFTGSVNERCTRIIVQRAEQVDQVNGMFGDWASRRMTGRTNVKATPQQYLISTTPAASGKTEVRFSEPNVFGEPNVATRLIMKPGTRLLTELSLEARTGNWMDRVETLSVGGRWNNGKPQ